MANSRPITLSVTLAIACCFVLPTNAAAQESSSPEFRREIRLPPLRMTYEQIRLILQRATRLINEPVDAKGRWAAPSAEFEYQGKKTEVHSLEGWQTSWFPDVATKLSFRWPPRTREITSIDLLFYDNFRSVSVSGASPERVDAMYGFLVTEFGVHTTWFGGEKFRLLSGFAILTSFFALCMIRGLRRPKGMSDFKYFAIASAGTAVGLVLMMLLPFDDWFPGVAIYSDSASFLVRYAPQVGGLGVILGVVALVVPLFVPLPLKLGRRAISSGPEAERPGTQ